jgi:hypothetical protein
MSNVIPKGIRVARPAVRFIASISPTFTTTTVAPTTTTVPVTDATSVHTADWHCIRVAESGYPDGNYAEEVGLGGAYEIMSYVWSWLEPQYPGYAYEYSPAIQDAAALKLYNMYGWQPWIADSYRCPFV